jgi:hypothetical protein
MGINKVLGWLKRLVTKFPAEPTKKNYELSEFRHDPRFSGVSTCAVSYGASRVYLLTQLVSQVLPPSSENACSDCAVSGLMPQIENRTRMVLPLIDSRS